MDKKVFSCAFNIDTVCVEVRFVDGSMISVDCTLVEAEVARNVYESSELEWLVYHAPVDYVNLRGREKQKQQYCLYLSHGKRQRAISLSFGYRI